VEEKGRRGERKGGKYLQARVSECRCQKVVTGALAGICLAWLGLAWLHAPRTPVLFQLGPTDALNQSEPQFPTREISVNN
jgi:hypothetical protein